MKNLSNTRFNLTLRTSRKCRLSGSYVTQYHLENKNYSDVMLTESDKQNIDSVNHICPR